MILYIYIGISLLTLLLFLLTYMSLIHNIKQKYKDKLQTDAKTDIAGIMFIYIKTIVFCFIPIVNLFFIFILLFMSEKVSQRSKEMIDDAFKNAE